MGEGFHHRDGFPVLPNGRRKMEKLSLDSFQLSSGSSPRLKNTSSKHLERPVCERKLISTLQLNETPFEFGSRPAFNQQGQA